MSAYSFQILVRFMFRKNEAKVTENTINSVIVIQENKGLTRFKREITNYCNVH